MTDTICKHGIIRCPAVPMVTCCRIGDIEWHNERIAWHRAEIERLESFQLFSVTQIT